VIAKAPHTAGSDAQARVREYIIAQVENAGLSAEVQVSGSISNILVRIPGIASTGTVIVTGHYDSAMLAPGAGDDGISVAAMLEAIRVLRTYPLLRNDVLFLFTDGEELGWQGAIAFIRKNPETKLESIVLCFDARPGNAPLLLQETSPGDAWLLRQMVGLPISAWGGSWKRDQERKEQDTDFDTFAPAGFTGLVFENEASGTRYHTNRDTVDAISADRVQAYGKTLLTLTRRFGTIDLSTKTAGQDASYVTLPLVGLVAYPGWVMSLVSGLGLLAMLGFMIAGWRKKQFTLGRFLLSVLGLLTGIALIVLLAQTAWGIILKKYVAEVYAYGGFESSSAWFTALMVGAFILMTIILILLNRKLGGVNVSAAAPVIFLMVGFIFFILGASSNPLTIPWFAWSFLGCVAGLGILLFVKNQPWKVSLLLCAAYPTLAVTVPWLVLATYTREDAWLPVLLLSAWTGLLAPQVGAIFGQALAPENKAKATEINP
jgi:Peptidase family M28